MSTCQWDPSIPLLVTKHSSRQSHLKDKWHLKIPLSLVCADENARASQQSPVDLHCVTAELSTATLLITHKEKENLGHSSLDGLIVQGEQQQNIYFCLKEQGRLIHTGNSSAEQQRQMFITSEHIQTEHIFMYFSLK